jgi:flagella basal body P-ring formation protein FlgA
MRLGRVVGLLLCCGWLAAAVEVRLRGEVELASPQALLGDVAELQGDELGVAQLRGLLVQALPDTGERTLTSARVQTLIARAAPDLPVLVQAGECRLRRSARAFQEEEFVQAAIAEFIVRQGPLEADARMSLRRAPAQVSLAADREHPFELVAEPLGTADWGELPYRIRILQGGAEQRRVLLVLHLERFRDVLVVTRDLRREQSLSSGDLAVRRQPVRDQSIADAPGCEEAIGCLTRCPLQAGQILTWSLIKRPPLVKGGSSVQLVVESERFSLSVAGVALGDGCEGETVSVRPAGGGRLLNGRVIGPDRVLIDAH